MAKILEATCAAGEVKVGAITVADAVILSQGVKSSTGVIALDEDKATYLTSNAEDVADLIETLNDLITTLTTTLTSMDAALLAPGAGTAGIAQLISKNAVLLTQKDNLK